MSTKTSKFNPNWKKIFLFGFIIGLLIGAYVAFDQSKVKKKQRIEQTKES